MIAPLFIIVTDADTLRDVAINVAAIEVIEDAGGGRTQIATSQHRVEIEKPIKNVFELLQQAVEARS